MLFGIIWQSFNKNVCPVQQEENEQNNMNENI